MYTKTEILLQIIMNNSYDISDFFSIFQLSLRSKHQDLYERKCILNSNSQQWQFLKTLGVEKLFKAKTFII